MASGGLNLLDDALALAAGGFRVFPLRPGTNVPLIPKPKVDENDPTPAAEQIEACIASYVARYGGGTGRGFHDATRDEDQIRAWWAKTPNANIGIATGRVWIDGIERWLTVIDIDEHDPAISGNEAWAALLAQHGADELDTWIVLSPTGGGRHIYLLTEKAYSNGAAKGLPSGIDVRGDGGYVVGPPSPRGDGSYEWDGADLPAFPIAASPAWLVAKLDAGDITDEAMRQRMIDAAEAKRARDPDARPMDRWMAQVRWEELLRQSGATEVSIDMDVAGNVTSTWARPGVDHASASLNWAGGNVLKVFTSNWPGLAENETYDKWRFAASQFHGGDMDAVKTWWIEEERRRGTDPAARAARAFADALATGDIIGIEIPDTMPPPPVPPKVTGPGAVTEPWSRPDVEIVRNDQHRAVELLKDAWRQINSPDCTAPGHPGSPIIYTTDSGDVRLHVDVNGNPRMEPVTLDIFRAEFAKYCRFWEWTADRSKKTEDGTPELKVTHKFLPDTHAKAVLASTTKISDWPLMGFSPLPVLHRDGTWATTRGYDRSTKYYVRDTFAAAPPAPSSVEIKDAVVLVSECFDQFPFATSGDFANAFALFLTPIMRPYLYGDVPLALINAHSPGIGKSALASAVATLHTGVPDGTWTNLGIDPKSDVENEKEIISILLTDPNAVIVWDNLDHALRSTAITRLVSKRTYNGRRLGKSEALKLANNTTPIITGNNIEIGGDYARRTYRIHLELPPDQIERPEKRVPAGGWKHADLNQWIVSSRDEIVRAMMTMINAWIAADRPMWSETGKGASFTEWSGVVGGILSVCGVEGFMSDDEAFQADADSEQAEWAEFLSCLHAVIGSSPITAATVLEMVLDAEKAEREGGIVTDLLHNAKLELAQALPGYVLELRPRGAGSMARSLGRAMGKRNGRREGNWVLKRIDLRTANKTHFIVTPLASRTNTASPAAAPVEPEPAESTPSDPAPAAPVPAEHSSEVIDNGALVEPADAAGSAPGDGGAAEYFDTPEPAVGTQVSAPPAPAPADTPFDPDDLADDPDLKGF